MIYPISRTTVGEAWLAAANLLADQENRSAYNVILDVEKPITLTPVDKQIVHIVDRFLVARGKHPVATVAGTIFPASHYKQRGAKGVLEDFPDKIYPKIKAGWGTYAGRMLRRRDQAGNETRPLEILIAKLRQQTAGNAPKRAAYEVSLVDVFADLPIYDPAVDSKRIMNQPCLAHLSFKLREDRGLMLTAFYRNHYYVERALGNLVGLSQLLYFVAHESGLEPRALVCHSTFARLDFDGGWTVRELNRMLDECNGLSAVAIANTAPTV